MADRVVSGFTKISSGTAAAWAATNTAIGKGIYAYESDTGRAKIGDGVLLYRDLPYHVDQVLTQALKDLLTKANQANGVVVLDANDLIPASKIPQSVKNAPVFVSNIAARDAIPEANRTSVVIVLDASADLTVDAGMAFYAWATDIQDWIKVGEQESMDVDLTDVLRAGASIADLSDGGGFVRMTDAERTAISDQGTRLASAENAISDHGYRLTSVEGTAANLDTRVAGVEGEVNGKIGVLTNLTTTEQGTLVGAINEVDAAVDTVAGNLSAEVTQRELDVASLQTALAALTTGQQWRDMAVVMTADARIGNITSDAEVALSGILPIADDDPSTLADADFPIGSYLVHKGTGNLVKVRLGADDQKFLTVVDVEQFVRGDTITVLYDLTNSPDNQEVRAIYTYTGEHLVKVTDYKWSVATGIALSATFVATVGTVLPADSVETAIAKIVGNLAAVEDRVTALETSVTSLIANSVSVSDFVIIEAPGPEYFM